MLDPARRTLFEARVLAPALPSAVREAALAAREGNREAVESLAAAFAHAAFVSPEAASSTYAAFRSAWLGNDEVPSDAEGLTPGELPPAFWTGFWALLDDAGKGH